MVKLSLLVTAVTLSTIQLAAAKSPLGLWSTEDRGGIVDIHPCGAALCGVIVGLTPTPEGPLPRDFQGGPQCHRVLLNNLRPEDDGRLHGTVTNPEDGRTYDAEVWVPEDGNLRLRGYIGLPLLGSTQIWPPFAGTVTADCHFH